MKKLIKLTIPLALIALLLCTQVSQGAYGVTVGQTFVYDCIKSELDITVGSNSASVNGFEIDGNHLDVGTSVDIEVTAVSSSVTYDISAGGFNDSESSSTFDFVFSSVFFIIYPMLLVTGFASFEDWNQTEVEEEPELFLVPFVETGTSTWDDFKDLATSVQTGSLISTSGVGDLVFNATYSDDIDNFVFESYMSGNLDFNDTISSELYYIEAEVEHHYQFAVEKATGIVLGMRMEGTIVGTSNSTTIDLSYNQHTEKSGYNLPAYEFGGGGFTFPFPGFGWVIAIPAVALVALAPIFLRKRK